MVSYGINIGHGHCKAVVLDAAGNETIMPAFPSQIAHAGDTGDMGTAQVVLVDRRPYWVGRDALLGSVITMYDQQRLADETFIPALTAGVMQRLGTSLSGVCFTCLPASWNDESLRKKMGDRVRAGAASVFRRVGVMSEPQAVVLSQVLNTVGELVGDEVVHQGRIGIVDIGSGTTDVSVTNQLNLEPQSAQTWRTGMVQALVQVQSYLNAAFDTSFRLSQVDMAVRERMIRVAGTMCELPLRWDEPIRRLAQEIVSNLGEAWGQGKTLDRILLAGGGSAEPLIVDAIQQKYPHAVVVEEPQYAIARGCARRARLLVREMSLEQAA